jgi:hypothetical protein
MLLALASGMMELLPSFSILQNKTTRSYAYQKLIHNPPADKSTNQNSPAIRKIASASVGDNKDAYEQPEDIHNAIRESSGTFGRFIRTDLSLCASIPAV